MVIKNMESKVLDTKEVSEKYTYNGNTKTRTHTIRSMVNGGSEFINYRCGRNSVNISRDIFPKVFEQMQKLQWNNTETEQSNNEQTLLEHIKQLQKQINKIKKEK